MAFCPLYATCIRHFTAFHHDTLHCMDSHDDVCLAGSSLLFLRERPARSARFVGDGRCVRAASTILVAFGARLFASQRCAHDLTTTLEVCSVCLTLCSNRLKIPAVTVVCLSSLYNSCAGHAFSVVCLSSVYNSYASTARFFTTDSLSDMCGAAAVLLDCDEL